jgi:hypothetical protein
MPTQDSATLRPGLTAIPRLRRSVLGDPRPQVSQQPLIARNLASAPAVHSRQNGDE